MLHDVSALRKLVGEAITSHSFPSGVPSLYEPAKYIAALGGKRLRPCLLLMARNLFSENVSEALPLALGIEFFHNFTLMHDDIMDKAPLRRGQMSVHEKWNSDTAILSGDALMIEAYRLICSSTCSNPLKILDIFNAMASKVCEGQKLDMDFETIAQVTLSAYLNMITLKTAVLIGAALQIGALSAGADEHSAAHLYALGCEIGTAFQLRDDYLDVYGGESFGKQVGGDILANKKTFLLLSALEAASPAEHKQITRLTASALKADEKIYKMTQIFNSLGVREQTEKAINDFSENALRQLDKVAASESRKSELRAIALSVGSRTV